MANNVNPNDLRDEALRPVESPKNYRRLLLLGLLGVLVLATLSLMHTIRPALATPLQHALAYAPDGKLNFVEVLKDGAKDGAGNTVDGLAWACSMAVSPDGKHVYVGVNGSAIVAVFARNPTDGKLTFVEAQKDGLKSVYHSVAVSPDGKHVYVGEYMGNAVVVFARNTTPTSPDYGKLTFLQVLKDGDHQCQTSRAYR